MSILSDFFISAPSTATEYNSLSDFPSENRCQFKRITPLEAAGILAVLRMDADRIKLLKEFPLLTPPDAEEWILGIPEDMTTLLAALTDAKLSAAAEKCAVITAEELSWTLGDFEDVLKQLRGLARRAVETKTSMFLWNSL